MKISPELLNHLIAHRRSIFPKDFSQKPIPKHILLKILENGTWAPNHKKTEPWLFKVFDGKARQKLGAFLASWYKNNTPPEKFLEKKYQKTLAKAHQSGCVIAICMQRDLEERIPEWEEVAAVACAVQNIWLSCTAYGIGAYWSSPKAIEDIDAFLKLEANQKCLGFLYMGYADNILQKSSRAPLENKVVFMNNDALKSEF